VLQLAAAVADKSASHSGPTMSGSGGGAENDFFEAVGRTLVAWQRVEGRLVGIYLQLLGSPGSWGAAGAAFYRVFALSGKVAMIEEASKWGLQGFPALLDELDRLLKKTRKTARKRNKLVHLEASEIDLEWVIGPPMWDTRIIDKKNYYDTKDIMRWGKEFDELYELLSDFSKRIPSDRKRARTARL
jgi:hypothetical protein